MNTRILASLLVTFLIFISCSSDDDGAITPDVSDSKSYSLMSVSNEAITGMVTFKRNSNNTTTVEVDLDGTTSGMHPAHIHMNTAAESGDIAISLEPINGATGMSSTTFSTKDDGTPISYEQLLDFNGYVNVHKSADELGILIAQGDIGQNELTGNSKFFTLDSRSNPDIIGDVRFLERVNGTTLIEVMLDGTSPNGEHPGHIHYNTAAEGGDIAVTFTPLRGETGVSKTQVSKLDNGTAITYEELLDFNGYVNIHQSADELGILIAQGDIGQNELTGDSIVYTLTTIENSGVSGDATFYKRMNGEALLVIDIMGTMAGDSHPSHLHMGDVDNPGDIVVSLNPVEGETGMSKTNIAMQDGGSAFGYDDVLSYNGYINVHKSATELETLLAQGNIGSN
ncbi:CHRD domain-containing protein [Mesonia ostreae]|uniref:CHRD domain-containing protein n=1 Tax=Mesonia ostreae TaxID=861110 RepID=A0ABU2KFU7_9FLAO|nr:CHRD domain-containing protein [Mesonia ostreae]MDT0293592.1 CHRD domain-containing protein [Mesonia ostreae]